MRFFCFLIKNKVNCSNRYFFGAYYVPDAAIYQVIDDKTVNKTEKKILALEASIKYVGR